MSAKIDEFSETYELAKAAEDSVAGNLEVHKENNTAKRIRRVGDPLQKIARRVEADEIDNIIVQKVESAIAKHLKDLKVSTVDVEENSSTNPGIEANVEATMEENVEVNLEPNVVVNMEENQEANIEVNVEEIAEDNVEIAEDNVEIDDSYLPVKNEPHVKKLEEDLITNMTSFRQKYQGKGAEKLSTTMRSVANKIIADSFLKEYNFSGGRGKKPFEYENVCKLIISCTTDAFNNYNDKRITQKEVEVYFKTNYVKYAKQRSEPSVKK